MITSFCSYSSIYQRRELGTASQARPSSTARLHTAFFSNTRAAPCSACARRRNRVWRWYGGRHRASPPFLPSFARRLSNVFDPRYGLSSILPCSLADAIMPHPPSTLWWSCRSPKLLR